MSDQKAKEETAVKRDLSGLEKRGGGFVEAVEATRMAMLITDSQAPDSPIIFTNRAFLNMLVLRRDEVMGRSYASLIGKYINPEIETSIKGIMASHIASIHDLILRNGDGREIWVSQIIDPIIEEGRIVRHFISFFDITERVYREQELYGEKGALERRITARTQRLQQAMERLEEETERRRRIELALRDTLIERDNDLHLRDFLLREIQHRTANAFQLTAGILNTQGLHSSTETREALSLAAERIIRVGEMHDLLTFRPSEPGLVDFSLYLRSLCKQTLEALSADGRIRIEVEITELMIWKSNLVIPLGLIVGETLTNAIKHAFPNERTGVVRIVVRSTNDDMMCICIEDNGVGMPVEQRKGSLGLRLIKMACGQIKGNFTMKVPTRGTGTVMMIDFPDPDSSYSS